MLYPKPINQKLTLQAKDRKNQYNLHNLRLKNPNNGHKSINLSNLRHDRSCIFSCKRLGFAYTFRFRVP